MLRCRASTLNAWMNRLYKAYTVAQLCHVKFTLAGSFDNDCQLM